MVKGEPWLLIVGFLAYAVAFAKLGACQAKATAEPRPASQGSSLLSVESPGTAAFPLRGLAGALRVQLPV